MNSTNARKFASDLEADIGIVYGTHTPDSEIFGVPRTGSIVLDLGGVRDCGPYQQPGIAESSGGRADISISVRRPEIAPDGPAILTTALRLDPYDTPISMFLKTRVVGNDLLAQAVGRYCQGNISETSVSNGIADLAPAGLENREKRDFFTELFFHSLRGWPGWKLFLKSAIYLPRVIARNWWRRLRGRAPVIILYHHLVSDRPHFLGIPTEVFYHQAEFLKRHYRLATLEEATTALRKGKLRAPTVVLTFDDGYQENFINLRAVSEQTGIPVTLFVSTDYMLNQKPFAHDLKRMEPGFLPLTWEQVTKLRDGGYQIGSHTRSHFDCGSMDAAALEREIVGSKKELEERLGQPVDFFSFPWGFPKNMSPAAVQLACATYPFVCSAYGGENLPAKGGPVSHLRRRNHFNDIWECELEMQSILQT
ncbi:MAG: polysaccharide deacetylase family protein [Candidatus Acidiferrales bacterium]